METREIPLEIAEFEIRPTHVGGDREFKGHGPIITVTAQLIQIGDRKLDLLVYMHAVEAQSDYTEFRSLATRNELDLRSRPDCNGFVILEVDGQPFNSYSYFEKAHNEIEVTPQHGGNLVEKFYIRGDFSGEDQPYARIKFQRQTVRLARAN